MTWNWFFRLGSPKWFYQMAGRWQPWIWLITFIGIVSGCYWGLFIAPPDYYQGDLQRIMYIHVPAAYLSMMVYVIMAVAGAIGLIWRMKMAYMVSISCSPIGAAFTFLALVTGSLWGKPTWGTYWVFDARLTSELILLFLYFGHMALFYAIDDVKKADKAAAILAIVGVVNIPIIHFSVEWWNSLHQDASLSKLQKPKIDEAMLWPLLVMIVSFKLFFVSVLFPWVRNHILWREKDAKWVKEIIEQ
ncbi:heme ABC transporter permease [Pleionea mediterranea]|jgi:heme exporter protein C|uniref:Heme exporter protein C n=1 Tax=Pleionea mediterranea TaxID=523701 RepID=A0A316FM64_9GAMM|nr:heme ABC transporter permease [Pleionea mediterranea]PWK49971.1 heme exporter protein C [Pleionea mediterranea]